MIQKSNFKIIKADESLLDAIAEIEKQCFSKPWNEKSIFESLTNEISYFYVAKIDSKAVGYIGFYIVSGEGYLYNVAVKDEYRNMGIGTALLKQAISVSRETNADFLSLEVRISNITAIKLYQKIGFEKVGIRKGFYSSPKEDALIMTIKESDL